MPKILFIWLNLRVMIISSRISSPAAVIPMNFAPAYSFRSSTARISDGLTFSISTPLSKRAQASVLTPAALDERLFVFGVK